MKSNILLVVIDQQLPTFLNMRATLWVLSHIKESSLLHSSEIKHFLSSILLPVSVTLVYFM